MQHLILRLEGTLLAFGAEAIDAYGVIRPFPGTSLLTGLLANALGWRRTQSWELQQLQERLVYAARIDREPADETHFTDYQTVAISLDDTAWTTRGRPQGRAGTPVNNLEQWIDYYADMAVTVALRLEPPDEEPDLTDLAESLIRPQRPLFIGRKTCLPTGRLFQGYGDGATALQALAGVPFKPQDGYQPCRAIWPEREGSSKIAVQSTWMFSDQRNWYSRLHGGGRYVNEGVIPRPPRQQEAQPEQVQNEEPAS